MNKTKSFTGLTSEEACRRAEAGLNNAGGKLPSKSLPEIIRTNVFTFFNLINLFLAAAVFFVGSFKSALFMFVVFWNVLIGIVQEVRAKRVTDRLMLISQPKAHVLRDGILSEIDYRNVVLGDLIKLSAGMQICADCEVKSGECEVNESLVTGESDPLFKKVSDNLLSGSFIVSGEVFAEAVKVGADSFANKITASARFYKKPDSKMFRSMNRIVKGISIIILPIMTALFYEALTLHGEPLETAVTSVVAAVIGMIPEGLVLLISVVMAVGAIKLSRHKALVQDMYCIETLARVDVLCLDKTGTLTTGNMRVEETVLLGENTDLREITDILASFSAALPDENPTASAVRTYFVKENTNNIKYEIKQIYPFSAAKKWSGVYFKGKGAYVLGAAEFVLGDDVSDKIRQKISFYGNSGKRVVLLAESKFEFNGRDLPNGLNPLALIIINDEIREEAQDALKFFEENNVEIKIISGDDPATVRCIAEKAGIKNISALSVVDMSKIGEDSNSIAEAANKYKIFGRTTPSQKLEIIKTLKAAGHTVGMTGDGVNDVPALKHADCGIAMRTGSDAARNVSGIVLMDSNFASLPKIVKEGRQSINNVERSAALFLTKTVFSLIVGISYIFIGKPYPLVPIQMTLTSVLFIGIPSFLLALEPNTRQVRGSFIENVLKKAIPYGFCQIACIMLLTALGHMYGLSSAEVRGIAVLILGIVSLFVLCRLCMPFNKRRAAMVVFLGAAFCAAVSMFENFLEITDFTFPMLFILIALILFAVAAIWYFPVINDLLIKKIKNLKGKFKRGKK